MTNNKIINAVIETARDLHDAGVMPEVTMREFEALKIEPVRKLTAEQITHIRKKYHVSQGVFAAYLNTNVSTIRSWEQGNKHPSGPSLKLLNLVDKVGLQALS